jgi:hypothetical protein
MPPLPWIAIPIALAAIHQVAGREVPKAVTKAIEDAVAKRVETFQIDWEQSIRRDTAIYTGLILVSLSSLLFTYLSLLPDSIRLGLFILVYAIPLIFTLRFLFRLAQFAPRVLNLKAELTAAVSHEIETSGMKRKVILKLYDSRTHEQLAAQAVGQTLFKILDSAKENWKIWAYHLGCYLVSYLALLLLRFQI